MSEILFVAYSGDCLVQGTLEVSAERLSDFLNERDEVLLRNAVMQAHEDARVIRLDELVLDLDELYAAEGSARRGSPERRLRTRLSRMEIDLAPYRVLGHVHAMPGADPVEALVRRKPMVPVTGATIAFELGRQQRMRDVSTLIVNRQHVRSVSLPPDPLAGGPSPDATQIDPKAKDYTGLIYN